MMSQDEDDVNALAGNITAVEDRQENSKAGDEHLDRLRNSTEQTV